MTVEGEALTGAIRDLLAVLQVERLDVVAVLGEGLHRGVADLRETIAHSHYIYENNP